MNNQGFWGAIEQFWTVDEKPRLHRRNTFFEDHCKITTQDSLKVGIVAVSVSITIVIFAMIGVIA